MPEILKPQPLESEKVATTIINATPVKIQPTETKKESKHKKVWKWVRRSCYLGVWLVIIFGFIGINLIDKGLHKALPLNWYEVIRNHYLYFYIFLLILLLLISKIHKLIFWVGGFLILPFYVILIFIPTTTLKGLRFVIKYIIGSSEFTRSFKFRIISTILVLVAIASIIFDREPMIIKISMALIALKLLAHYSRKIYQISKPLKIIGKAQDFMFKSWEKMKTTTLLKGVQDWKALNPEDEKYNQKKMESLSLLGAFNWVFIKTARLLKRMQGEKVMITYFIISVGYTFFLTVFLFGLEYYAISIISPVSITGIKQNFFSALYFSFNTLITINYGDIVPSTTVARLLVSFESFCGLILGVILFFIFTTVILEKYKRDMDVLIEKLRQEGKGVRLLIEKEFAKGVKELITEFTEYQKKINPKQPSILLYDLTDEEEE